MASTVSSHPAASSYARYVGRVGALAVALGVGAAVVSMPAAFADTTGSAGSTGNADASSTSSTGATKSSSRSGARTTRPDTSERSDAPSASRLGRNTATSGSTALDASDNQAPEDSRASV